MSMCVCVHVHARVHNVICMYVCMHVCTYSCTYRMDLFMYGCMYVPISYGTTACVFLTVLRRYTHECVHIYARVTRDLWFV